MVLLEAAGYKVPSISFDIQTGPAEIIEDGKTGFLIPPFDLEQMEEKIELLIQKRCFAQKVCTAGGKEQTKICTRQNRGTVGTIVRRNYIKKGLAYLSHFLHFLY